MLFPYGLLSAGTVHDEVTDTGAVKRVGKYTFTGNENWQLNGSYQGVCQVNLPRKKSASYWGAKGNCVHSKYITGTQTNMYNGIELDTIGFTDSTTYGYICCGKNVYDNRESLTGIDFYYELAEPITITFTSPKDLGYNVQSGGTEELLPTNQSGSGPITAPVLLSVNYPLDAVGTLTNLPKNYISVESMDSFTTALGNALNLNITKTWDSANNKWTFSVTSRS